MIEIQIFISKSKFSKNLLLNLSAMLERIFINSIPVFGTEEALVEPMLLALDTTASFLVDSAKKPTEQNIDDLSLQDQK